MLIIILMLQPLQNLVFMDVLMEHEVELVCQGVEASLLQLLINQMIAHFKRYE